MAVISKITGAPFRFWCQKVLPAVYDDSLSYYELLCKVVDYLNKVMEDDINIVNLVNENEENFNTLKDFVDTYFDNLDVQEEINHKLDVMAEDGSLLAVITPYLEPIISDYEATLDADLAEYKETIDNDVADFKSTVNEQVTAQNTEIANFKSNVNTTVAEQDNDISVMQAQMNNFIENHSGELTFTELYRTTESLGAHAVNETFNLSDDYTKYPELDIYWSYNGVQRFTRVKSSDVLATGVEISFYADAAVSQANVAPMFFPFVKIVNGNSAHTQLKIDSAYSERWSGVSTDSAYRDIPSSSADYSAGSIVKVVGVSYQDSAELIDIRVGGNATTYPTAGDAVRGQYRDLNSAIEHVYNGEQYIPTNFNAGFIGGTGSITGAGPATKEVYTNAIGVSESDVLYISLTWAESNEQWVAIATYDSSNTFLSRTTLYSETGSSYNTTYTVPSGVSFIRLTYRTYGSAVLDLYKKWSNIIQIIDDEFNAKVPTISVTNSMLQNGSVTPNKLSEEVANKTRNIFDYEWVHGQYAANGDYADSSISDVRHAAVKPIISVQGGETYTISWGAAEYTGGGNFYIEQFSSNGTMLKYDSIAFTDGKKTVTLEDTTVNLGLFVYMWGTNAPSNWTKCIPSWTQIEVGSSATNYVAPYQFNNSMIDTASLFSSDLFIEKVGNLIPYNKNSLTVKSIAHRGDDIYAPQCTAPSYILAKKHGYNIVENDLWLSEDGELIMWHDTTLAILGNLVDINGYLMYTDGTNYYYVNPSDNSVYTWNGSDYTSSAVLLDSLTRCAGANYGVNSEYNVIGLPLSVLKRIDFGVYKGQQFKGTQILTFEEWVVLCKQLGVEIYVDKKLAYTNELLTRVANIVKKYGMDKYTSWLGIGNISDINLLRSICPNARVGILAHPNSTNIETYVSVNTGRGFFFNGNAKDGLTAEAVQLGLNAGYEVEAWYVDTRAYTEEQQFNFIRTVVSYGLTGLTLDHYRVDEAFNYLLDLYSY